MKYLTLSVITLYQIIISPLVKQLLGIQKQCRYEQTCSEYAKEQISHHGIGKGGYLAIKRILSCQPFVKTRVYPVQ